ncbi:oligoribonuclease [Bacillus chungangensis]|uniref:YqzN/YkzM domain-containing protein n=1 Tax=Bacillus chungangensis TaxID=587633 RepID=A0ABT9WQ71_9BACI|nr:oligoribonuclease [Bacillus chungangensis]MDQ0175234.1 hypothetical protein [Bacillus chungangensis]
MAKNKQTTTNIPPVSNEPKYSRSEIIGAAASFGVMPELMAGAMKLAGKNHLTRSEIEKAIRQFKKREA